MELTAKLIKVLPLQTGTGKNGEWKRQDIIVETDDRYPKKICIGIWNDKIEPEKLKVGKRLNINFDIQSREYNERWYTHVNAWRIEVVERDEVAKNDKEKKEDDLPFDDDFLDDDEEDLFPF